MKRIIYASVVLLILLGFGPADAMALGLGFYGQAAGGKGEFEYEDYGTEFDVDTSHGGIGIVLDTNVSQNRLFNYRLNIGFENFDLEAEDGGETLELDSFVIDQDFGFGFATQNMRVWAGPEIRISWSEGDLNSWDYKLFGFGLGPVAGINFNFGNNITLGLKGGILGLGYAGEAESNGVSYDTEANESIVFINAALIFRLNE